jgi:EpsI family protein
MSNKLYMMCLVLICLSIIAVTVISRRPVPIVVQTNLEKIPMEIYGYLASEDSYSDAIYSELNADKNLYRHYKSHNGNRIDLYIGYYGTAKGGRTRHNPYGCLPSAGLAILEAKKIYLKQVVSGKIVAVNYILSRNNDMNIILLHWYQTSGNTIVSSGFKQNIERFIGRIRNNRNDGAYVQITASTTDDDVNITSKRVAQFAEKVLNLLPYYWPEEI